jgi:aspartate-semialdehyde dehydrogenase
MSAPLPEPSLRVAIAGATSLRGKDLKYWLEESGFPAGEIRLVDEEIAAGLLTEVAGEPAVVQSVNESSFEGLRFVFFAGSAAFAAKHAPTADRAGASVIDMTGGLWAGARARPWIPRLDALMSPPAPTSLSNLSNNDYPAWVAPSTPAIVACSLAAAFAELSPVRIVIVFFHPVSERGEQGISELEGQTVKLLSFQPIPQQVFDTQVAFNMTSRWGSASQERLPDLRKAIAAEVKQYLAGRISLPAVMLVQAPVFYGHAFSAWAEFKESVNEEALSAKLKSAGFNVVPPEDPSPSNLLAAGEAQPAITVPEPDANVANGYWLWGAADNFRLACVNATQIAERLLAS